MGVWLLVAMGAVLISWALLLAMLVGIGLLLQRAIEVGTINASTLLMSPWLGFASLILFLHAWHFIFPIQWPALLILMIVAAIGFIVTRNELLPYLRSIRIGWPLGIAIALAALWVANRAIAPGNAFDSGLYHYAVVRWSHEHPVMPGLASLHPQYGLNNSCHLFVALLQVGPWDGRANHLANGLLLFIWIATVAISATLLHRGRGSRAQNLFNVVLLIPFMMYSVSKEPSSPTTDLPQSMLAFAAASAFVRLLADDARDEPAERALLTIAVAVLGATALCMKVTAASTMVPLGAIALIAFLLARAPTPWPRAAVLWSIGLSSALALTWMGRGLFLSGCPFYPSRFLSIPAEWRVTTEMWRGLDPLLRVGGETVRVDMLQRVLSSPEQRVPPAIGRPVLAALQNASDTGRWLIAMALGATIEVALPIFLAIVAAIGVLARRLLRRAAGSPVRAREWLICIPPLVGFTVWVIVSPEPRYIASSLWILAAALLSMMWRTTRATRVIVGLVMCMSALPIAYRMLALKFNPESGPVRQALFIPAGPDHGFHPIPTVELKRVHLKWGLVVNIPKRPGPAWDAPLPAAASVDYRLILRNPSDIRSGFMIDLTRPAPPTQ